MKFEMLALHKTRVKCPRKVCGNIWGTKSKKKLVSCPICFYKLEIEKCRVR
jgi:hypothetical protein